MMQDVAMKPSITFVYRLSGISRTFTHLYFDNFYSKKLKEENLYSIVNRELARRSTARVAGSLVISMSLMARKCPKDTVVRFLSKSNCTEIPLNITHICAIHPGYLQGGYWSVMTRHYRRYDTLSEDVFFELENTFPDKVFLIMNQLKQAGVYPKAFMIERYDFEPQSEIHYYEEALGVDVKCEASPFAYTAKTKPVLANF
ncbi:uncharacterized protein LOC142795463 [Rhipicephalus microplus]|uniref:uncharacterized protein LOC142795463 n=1 Tax=Rhipicephalus microplus TaxID=6941 RepID=UPI003F6AD5C2